MDQFADYSHAIVSIALWALLVQGLNLMTATAKGKLGLPPGATPAADYSDRTYRINRAYLNAVETLAVFAAVTLAAMLAGASAFWVNWLASLGFVARLAMAVVHVQGLGKTEGGLRTGLFVFGWALNVALALLAVAAAIWNS